MLETALPSRDRRTLVTQTREHLVRRIRAGEFKPGQRLPSESDLAQTYEVSRVTMREALKGLQQEHLLYTVHGSGTYVADTPITRQVTHLQSVTELAADLGYAMTTRVLDVRRDGVATAAMALNLAAAAPLMCLERLRLVDGRPAIYSLDYFAATLAEDTRAGIEWEGSLFTYIETHNNLTITHSVATLRAALLAAALCARINAKRGQPWLLMEQTNFTSDNRPVVYSLDYHHGEMFSFDVLRRRY